MKNQLKLQIATALSLLLLSTTAFAQSERWEPTEALGIIEDSPEIKEHEIFVNFETEVRYNHVRFINTTNDTQAGEGIWEFGDGTRGMGARVIHTYPVPGVFEACLTLYHPAGTATTCKPVVVRTIYDVSKE